MSYGLPAAAPDETSSPSVQATKNIDFTWGVKIPMRDGVQLNGTLYKPKESQPVPTIFTLTLYNADRYKEIQDEQAVQKTRSFTVRV